MKIICAIAVIVVLSACRPVRDRLRPEPPVVPTSGVTSTSELHEPAASPKLKPDTEAGHVETVAQPESISPTVGPGTIDEWNSKLEDVFFDYDQAGLTAAALSAIEADAKLVAAVLAGFPRITVIVEGHCDERGSAEYNLALGDRRAGRAVQALRDLGISETVFQTISYGREKPQCADPNESCWRRNRRAHFLFQQESGHQRTARN